VGTGAKFLSRWTQELLLPKNATSKYFILFFLFFEDLKISFALLYKKYGEK
jgi:hypothetical protein